MTYVLARAGESAPRGSTELFRRSDGTLIRQIRDRPPLRSRERAPVTSNGIAVGSRNNLCVDSNDTRKFPGVNWPIFILGDSASPPKRTSGIYSYSQSTTGVLPISHRLRGRDVGRS